ncbi:MAG TPA: M20/M25/M40 family metallo-hydrolase [Anaerolineaceae bacterium]
MSEITPFLKKLLTLPGLSAYEDPVREAIATEWRPLVDELSVSRVGSLHGVRRGRGTWEGKRPGILIATHMDAIGLMVTGVVDGLLRVTEVGGVDPRVLPYQPVTIHGRRDLPGVIVQPPESLLPSNTRGKPVRLQHLLVDTGLLPEEVHELVRVGDLISFATQPVELAGETLAGHTLDNRASVAALTICLQELKRTAHPWDVWAVATVQEEETYAGGYTSPVDIHPDLAIAVDVTFAKGPGVSDYRGFPLGKGFTVGYGANVHTAMFTALKDLADEMDLPNHVEVMPNQSGTDAYPMQVVEEGIPTAIIGIPLRYMHTPVETVSLKDINRVGRLLAEFISRLDDHFMEKICWDGK